MTRADSPFGKDPAEGAKVLDDQHAFEPVLRRGATVVIDTDRPHGEVVQVILDRVHRPRS